MLATNLPWSYNILAAAPSLADGMVAPIQAIVHTWTLLANIFAELRTEQY